MKLFIMEDLLYSPVVLGLVVLFIIMTITIISLFGRVNKLKETGNVADMETLTNALMGLQATGQVHLNTDGKYNWSVGKHTIDYHESNPNSITIDGKSATPMETLLLIHKITK